MSNPKKEISDQLDKVFSKINDMKKLDITDEGVDENNTQRANAWHKITEILTKCKN